VRTGWGGRAQVKEGAYRWRKGGKGSQWGGGEGDALGWEKEKGLHTCEGIHTGGKEGSSGDDELTLRWRREKRTHLWGEGMRTGGRGMHGFGRGGSSPH
jgi:hypothetical protein